MQPESRAQVDGERRRLRRCAVEESRRPWVDGTRHSRGVRRRRDVPRPGRRARGSRPRAAPRSLLLHDGAGGTGLDRSRQRGAEKGSSRRDRVWLGARDAGVHGAVGPVGRRQRHPDRQAIGRRVAVGRREGFRTRRPTSRGRLPHRGCAHSRRRRGRHHALSPQGQAGRLDRAAIGDARSDPPLERAPIRWRAARCRRGDGRTGPGLAAAQALARMGDLRAVRGDGRRRTEGARDIDRIRQDATPVRQADRDLSGRVAQAR